MASDCEIQFVTDNRSLARRLTQKAADETWRLHDKYSRYLNNNIVARINNAQGKPVSVDAETAALLNFAIHCYQLSDGLFDISSGILRKVWRFDGSDNVPNQQSIDALMPLIGLDKIDWDNQTLLMPAGMELDFGGIGKEYAVDKVLKLLSESNNLPMLVNFGGDIAANCGPTSDQPWFVGISTIADESKADDTVQLHRGGIATSGDTKRYLLKEGIRYSHILNPTTGWPVRDAPHSVTVLANSCTDAGILATLAMLQGSDAERFLKNQQVEFLCQR